MLKDSGNWDYSELSKSAKEHGGPDALIDDIRADSYEEGKFAGMIMGGATVGAIGLLALAFNAVRKKWQERDAMKAKSQASAKELQAKLKEYEARRTSEDIENVNLPDSYVVPSGKEQD